MDFCASCSVTLNENEGYKCIRDDVVTLKCELCYNNESLKDYIQSRKVTTKLLTLAAVANVWFEYNSFDRIRKETAYFVQKNEKLIKELDVENNKLGAKARLFGEKVWLPALRQYYADSEKRGHSGKHKYFKALLWGSAGRVLLTIQGKDKYDDNTFTIIFDEDSKTNNCGIQSIEGTLDKLSELFDLVTNEFPKMKPDKDVTIQL